MTCFRPLGPTDGFDKPVAWFAVGPESATFALPAPGSLLGCTVRLASAAAGPDMLFALGDDTVTVDKPTGIFFPAGTMETIGLGGRTHLAVMVMPDSEAVEPQTGEINVTVGIGE